MKLLIIIACLILCTEGLAQKGSVAGQDSLKQIMSIVPSKIFTVSQPNTISIHSYTYDKRLLLAPYALSHDSTYSRQLYLYNFLNSDTKQYFISNFHYWVDNPLQPVGSRDIASTLIMGTMEYLLYLFWK